jgi:hypothetical protein
MIIHDNPLGHWDYSTLNIIKKILKNGEFPRAHGSAKQHAPQISVLPAPRPQR